MTTAASSAAYAHHFSSPLGELSDDNMAIDSDSASSVAVTPPVPRAAPVVSTANNLDDDSDANGDDADADADADGDADAEADPDYAEDGDDGAANESAAVFQAASGSRVSSKVRLRT